MGFLLLVLLCRELSLGWAIDEGGFEDIPFQMLPAPEISLEPRFPVKLGEEATYQCVGAYGSTSYRLIREERGKRWTVLKVDAIWKGRGARFSMVNVTAEQAGDYSCLYEFNHYFSWNSDKIPLIVRGALESPFLWVFPSETLEIRQRLTFHCNSSLDLDKFYLYHGPLEEENSYIKPTKVLAREVEFLYREMQKHLVGNYVCIAYSTSDPYHWTDISNRLTITVSGALPFSFIPGLHLIPLALTVATRGELLA